MINNKKHILHFPKWYPHPADVQNGVFIKKHIAVSASKYNCSVVFATSAKQKSGYHIESHFDENVFTIKVFFKEFEHQNLLKPLVHAFRYIMAILKGISLAIKRFGKPDLIHAHVLLRTALIAWFYGAYYQTPYLISEHWSGFIFGKFQRKNRFYKKLAIFAFNKATKIIVVSEILKNRLVEIGIKASQIIIVPNVVEALPAQNIKSADLHTGKVIFVTVADLVDHVKNISDIIRVVADVSKSLIIEFWIIGDGEDRENLINLAGSLGILNSVVFFKGRKTNEEVLAILNEIDFLVLNSNYETFSVVAAEALLTGKPVIATRCGGPEIFVNETNGILIEPGNPEALALAIVEMTAKFKSFNPEILKSSIREKFGREAVGNKILSIYDEITG